MAAPLLEVEPNVPIVEGQYIVKFREDVATVFTNSLKQTLSESPKFEYTLSGFHGFAGTISKTELVKLQASKHIEYIQPGTKMYAYGLVYQDNAAWGISRISSSKPGNRTYVFEESAGQETCAYVVDSGIFVNHPDFEGRATHLANFSEDVGDEDNEGHGTHVAGTIGSRTYGVAKKTKLYAVKVLDSYGAGTISGIIAGINFVAKDASTRSCPKGVVANMNLGGRKNPAINQAIAAAVASGVFFAVAAGNDGEDARYVSPASEPTVCTVGATAMNDNMPSWSNYGPFVDLLAPGANITSLHSDGATAMHDGTSMASPHVAGLAAYLLGLEGGLGTKGLCERIARMGVVSVIKNVKRGTANTLINNGALRTDLSAAF